MPEISDIVLTHGGKFHADDVFASALLQLLKPEVKIQRVFQVPEGFDGLVFDLGWGAYDHHQTGAPVRENGVPYAAFGLLWREYGGQLLEAEDAQRFDQHFVQPLDLDDNTGCGGELPRTIGDFNPLWDREDKPDDCFVRAVALAKTILENRLEAVRGMSRAKAVVKAALAKMTHGVVVLSVYCPWRPFLEKSDAEFVVYPSQRGGYSAQCVPLDDDPNGALKRPFPESWGGKSPEELRALTGIPTLRFCHNNRFLVAADTLEDAVAACLLSGKR